MTHDERDALLYRLDERTARIDRDLLGNGAPGSSMRERVAKLESQSNWWHRGLYSVLPSLVVAAAAQWFGIHLPVGGQS